MQCRVSSGGAEAPKYAVDANRSSRSVKVKPFQYGPHHLRCFFVPDPWRGHVKKWVGILGGSVFSCEANYTSLIRDEAPLILDKPFYRPSLDGVVPDGLIVGRPFR